MEDIKPDYSGVPGPALDSVRMRLAQLTHSLRRIRDDLSRAELPQWYTLQSQISVTLSQLLSVTSTLQHFHDVLDTTMVYPLPKFPTTSHENLLTTLLRKKNIPEVEEWIKDAVEVSGIDMNLADDAEVQKVLDNNESESQWAIDVFAKEFETRENQGSNDDLDVLGSMKASKSVRQSTTVPFAAEDILKYMSTGEITGEEVESEEPANQDTIMLDG
ncbi:Mediator of RNA polymerase II transcription subunit 8 [Nakaseomyces bracarensis]|uniref:Mediator of RNA polymerase II transcription subunit 8 n=1 Tax=Nakaseomyces bracarensis TaxID=273131 RepID=A0ABR4P130_9SACH